MHIEKSDHGLTVRLEDRGSLAFFLQTLIRAKFYDDGGVDGLLSPLLNSAIAATVDRLDTDQPEAASYYSDWVAHWQLARVSDLISSSSNYLSASPSEQKAIMRTALYPHQPKQ